VSTRTTPLSTLFPYTTLFRSIAHELRTPLTVMRGRLEAMEDGVVELDIEEVRDLHAQVLLLTRLVEDLRTLSLADAGRLSLRVRSEEHTSELQSRENLVCRLL